MTSTDAAPKPAYLTAPGRQDIEWGVFIALADDVVHTQTYEFRNDAIRSEYSAVGQFGGDKVQVKWRTATRSSWSTSAHGDEFGVGVSWADGHAEVADDNRPKMTRLEALASARRKADLNNSYEVRFEVISRKVTYGDWVLV